MWVEGRIDPEHVATEHRDRETLGIGTGDADIGDEPEEPRTGGTNAEYDRTAPGRSIGVEAVLSVNCLSYWMHVTETGNGVSSEWHEVKRKFQVADELRCVLGHKYKT
jgi:hypothetical protein